MGRMEVGLRRSLGEASILSLLPLEVLVKIQAKLSRHYQEEAVLLWSL